MESQIVKNLCPEFDPVAVVWSDAISEDALQFKKGKFGCVLYLFAEASINGTIAGGSRENVICTGGRAALGFGCDFDASDEQLDMHAALFSKGLQSASNLAAYQAEMKAAPKNWRALYEYGERRHCTAELAREWILHEFPRYDIQRKHVLFKPLSRIADNEDIRAVIFPANPFELSGLVTLAGSIMQGTDPLRAPQGTDCCSITAFAYAEAESASPRAVLGMMGSDGREIMRRRFREDIMTLTLPAPLFFHMEQEADDCVLQLPPWKR